MEYGLSLVVLVWLFFTCSRTAVFGASLVPLERAEVVRRNMTVDTVAATEADGFFSATSNYSRSRGGVMTAGESEQSVLTYNDLRASVWVKVDIESVT